MQKFCACLLSNFQPSAAALKPAGERKLAKTHVLRLCPSGKQRRHEEDSENITPQYKNEKYARMATFYNNLTKDLFIAAQWNNKNGFSAWPLPQLSLGPVVFEF